MAWAEDQDETGSGSLGEGVVWEWVGNGALAELGSFFEVGTGTVWVFLAEFVVGPQFGPLVAFWVGALAAFLTEVGVLALVAFLAEVVAEASAVFLIGIEGGSWVCLLVEAAF